MIKIISKYKWIHKRNKKIRKAERYYENHNDILYHINPENVKRKEENKNPLRNADNRIPNNYHQLLTDQKAAYMMTEPPSFDVNDKEINEKIVTLLGDGYNKKAQKLVVDAANAGIGWVHVWKDADGLFRWATVDPKEIIPIWSNDLEPVLEGVLRVYESREENGDTSIIYQFWDHKEVWAFKRGKGSSIETLQVYSLFQQMDTSTNEMEYTSHFKHGWSKCPFIPFKNNEWCKGELHKYKRHIDVYDKIFSGYVNDLEDIQELIFIITNYGGANKDEFLQDLQNYKMIKLDQQDGDDPSGVETLAIEIPVEARNTLLAITEEKIFVSGQGVNPNKLNLQNNSGAALKFIYSLLDLKATLTEGEFRIGFGELVRFILEYLNFDRLKTIKQTWTRTAISNELEQAEIISRVAAVSSEEAIAKHNPIVENWEHEMDQIAKKKQEQLDQQLNAAKEYSGLRIPTTKPKVNE